MKRTLINCCLALGVIVAMTASASAEIKGRYTGWWTDSNGKNHYGPIRSSSKSSSGYRSSGYWQAQMGQTMMNSFMKGWMQGMQNNAAQQQARQRQLIQQRAQQQRINQRRIEAMRQARVKHAAQLRAEWDRRDEEISQRLAGVFDLVISNDTSLVDLRDTLGRQGGTGSQRPG